LISITVMLMNITAAIMANILVSCLFILFSSWLSTLK
jgi:hypothetical protein